MAGTLTAPIRQSGMDADGLLLDITLAEQMAAEQLTERFDIYDSGMISYAGDVAGSMSDTLRFLFANLGWHLSMDATVNETTDVSPSNVVDDYADVAVARRALALSFSQFAQIVDGGRILVDPMRLATSLVGSFRRGRMGQLITTGQGFATTGVDGTAYNDVDDLFTIMDLAAAAGATADMPIAMMMRNVGQWNRIRDSLRSEVGPPGLPRRHPGSLRLPPRRLHRPAAQLDLHLHHPANRRRGRGLHRVRLAAWLHPLRHRLPRCGPGQRHPPQRWRPHGGQLEGSPQPGDERAVRQRLRRLGHRRGERLALQGPRVASVSGWVRGMASAVLRAPPRPTHFHQEDRAWHAR